MTDNKGLDIPELKHKKVYTQEYVDKLEKENAELKAKNKWYSEQVCYKECAEVWGQLDKAKAQIEKMKCCYNCKHKKSEVDRCELLMYSLSACLCKNKDKWELKE